MRTAMTPRETSGTRYAVLLILQGWTPRAKKEPSGTSCLSATSTTNAPRHVVPADDKKNARLIISQFLLDVFKGLKTAYPEPTAKRRRDCD